MAKGGQGKGGNAQMSQPPITKYRKHIGTYQKEKTQKVAKRDFRDKADARKDRTKEGALTSILKYVGGIFFLLVGLYGALYYLIQK